MADALADTADLEVEVEITVRVRSRSKGLTRNVTRGQVGRQLGASEIRHACREGTLRPAHRAQLAEQIASFARVQLSKMP